MKGLLTVYSTKRDVNGNVYYAVEVWTAQGTHARGAIGTNNIDVTDCFDKLQWWVNYSVLPKREFKRFKSTMPYLGSTWADVKKSLLAQLKQHQELAS